MRTIILVSLFSMLVVSKLFAEVETRFNGNYVEIYWENPTGINIDYFVIEKSKNGIKFKEFQTIPYSNNENTKMNFYPCPPQSIKN